MAGNEFEAMRAAKQNAKARLFAIPGVHAVGLGPKQVGGQTTAQPAIIVYVLEKKPPSNVPDEQLIPAEIDGYATDVIQSGMPSLAAAKADDVDEVNDNTSRPRPLMGGVQMVVALSESSGTLGFLGTLANGDVVAVTNWHDDCGPKVYRYLFQDRHEPDSSGISGGLYLGQDHGHTNRL
jgi:hypothetical protein